VPFLSRLFSGGLLRSAIHGTKKNGGLQKPAAKKTPQEFESC